MKVEMKKVLFLCIILLILTLLSGCQTQSEENTKSTSSHTTTDNLNLQITAPTDGRETSWGFTRVRGIVSQSGATLTVNDDSVQVAEDGSFESDYILLSEGHNELCVVATIGDEKVSQTISVIYTCKLHVSLSLNLEPDEDYFTETPAEIGGRVSDPRAEVTVNGRAVEIGTDGFFSVMLELAEEKNKITATAKLRDQVAQDTIEAIYVPLVPLSLNIAAQQDGYETQVNIFKVTGSVSDPEVKVLINDIAAPVTAAGAFYAYIELDEGVNQIDAIAIRGNESVADTIHVTYSPPATTPDDGMTLKVDSPQNNTEYRVNVIPVTGTISDPLATLVVNGMEAAVDEDGSFQGYTVLNEGENNIKIMAIKDLVKTTKNIIVTFTPALIVYLYDQPEQDVDYTKEPMTFIGKVNKPEASVTVDGQDVSVAPDGSFTAQVLLKEGSNQIKAVATIGDERDEAYIIYRVENGILLTVPGYSHFFDASSKFEQAITLEAGEIKRLNLELESRKDGPGRFYVRRLVHVEGEYGLMPLPWPKGLNVYLEPSEFIAYPNTTYSVDLVFKTTPELITGTYYFHFYYNMDNGFFSNGWIKVIV